jgi:hypothetical protein
MTETQVEGLIGARGSDAVLPTAIGEGAVEAWTAPDFHGAHEALRLRQWQTFDKCIKVGFDDDGRAVYAILTTRAHLSLWQRFRLWLGM